MSVYREICKSPERGVFDLEMQFPPMDGYLVAGESVVFPDTGSLTPVPVNYLVRHALSRYIGWRTDGETGEVRVSQADWYQSLSAALVVARDRGEPVVFDVANDREILLSV